MTVLRVSCPAKINLYLKVTARRPDGYHELLTVMQPLTLADDLELSLQKAGTAITLSCSHPELPTDARNLAVQAARLFRHSVGGRFGLHLRLKKNIPLAAGLGGGSSDAAAVLGGLNQLCGHPLSPAELHDLARQLGADVPFFLIQGPALATGIGEILQPLTLPSRWLVLANPGFTVSTAWVYRQLRPPFTPAPPRDLAYWQQTPPEHWLHNDLEEPVFNHYPEVKILKEALVGAGARAALMSGSGPTVFGLCADRDQAIAVAAALRQQTGWWVAVTQGVAGAPG